MNERLKGILPFLIGLGFFAALAAFNQWREFALWRNYALSGVLLGGFTTWLFYHYDVRIPHYIQWTIIAATLTHYVGGSLGSPDPYHMGLLGMHGINGAYHHFEWWDHLTHGAGIAASAMGFAYLYEIYQTRRGLQWSGSGVWIVTMLAALTVGVGVELYEFLGKQAFQTIDQGGYENTMRDLHFNLIGGGIGATLAVTVNRTQFRETIQRRWGTSERVPRSDPWWHHISPAMSGMLTFTFIPAMTAVALGTQFFAQEIPPDDIHLYDEALWTLTIAAAFAIILAPLATQAHKWWNRRMDEA